MNELPTTNDAKSSAKSAAAKKKHILVVEDERHLAVGIKYNLEAENYRVTLAGDGPTALKLIEQKGDVNLLILDLMLPGMSGYDVCEALRESGASMPVLILSARTLSEDRTRGFEVGANQYLTKPFDLDELLSRVKNLLQFHGSRTPAKSESSQKIKEFEFDDVQVNFLTYEVRVQGELVRITQMELKLLKYFIENQDRVIPRSELLENIWDMPGYANTRAPDQFILRLRKIIEPDPQKPKYLLTIRDTGYRFVAAGLDQ